MKNVAYVLVLILIPIAFATPADTKYETNGDYVYVFVEKTMNEFNAKLFCAKTTGLNIIVKVTDTSCYVNAAEYNVKDATVKQTINTASAIKASTYFITLIGATGTPDLYIKALTTLTDIPTTSGQCLAAGQEWTLNLATGYTAIKVVSEDISSYGNTQPTTLPASTKPITASQICSKSTSITTIGRLEPTSPATYTIYDCGGTTNDFTITIGDTTNSVYQIDSTTATTIPLEQNAGSGCTETTTVPVATYTQNTFGLTEQFSSNACIKSDNTQAAAGTWNTSSCGTYVVSFTIPGQTLPTILTWTDHCAIDYSCAVQTTSGNTRGKCCPTGTTYVAASNTCA